MAVNGFRKCVIFPFNRHVFRDDDFAIHSRRERSPTLQPRQEENEVAPSERDSEDEATLFSIKRRLQIPNTVTTRPLVNSPSTASINRNLIKPVDISPMSSCYYACTSNKGRRGATALIT